MVESTLSFALKGLIVNNEKAKMLLEAFYPDSSNCLVLNLDDAIIFAGENRLSELGADSAQQLIGKRMQDVLPMQNQEERMVYFADMLRLKHKACCSSDNMVRVIVSAPFVSGKALHLTEIRSIYNENHTVVGCIIEARNFSLARNNVLQKTIKLSARQEELMFMLAIGFSQKEIADIYEVRRGTVIKNIGVICDKFGIAGASGEKLIELVYEYGYGVPPYHLLKTGIFEIPAQVITTSFFRSLLI